MRGRERERRKEWEVSGGQGEEAEEEAAVQKVLVELVTSLSKGEVGTFFPPLCGFSQCRFLTCGSHARQGCCGSVCVCVCVCACVSHADQCMSVGEGTRAKLACDTDKKRGSQEMAAKETFGTT